MPAIYAHDRFGTEVSERVNNELRETINRHYTQYQIGLQGPDIYFFYRPWGKNKVNQYGSHLHAVSAYPFFEHALRVVRHMGRGSREYAYLMGFICHFILDSECHPYVAWMIKETGVQHLEIEEEFEKMLLRMDGQDALAYPLAGLVPTDRETAEAIAPFYGKGITPEITQRALKDLKLVKRLFTRPGAAGQAVINTSMKILGNYDRMKGLMNQRRDNPACKESSQGLLQRYENAVPVAVRMIESFDETVRRGGRLNVRFDRTFE
ncbi:MAG: zinc dependent phospholipase C family protein [Lachnospiraceae bacterium]|nr:zinc dependent phospholipase C family protein [Lachnospiraceae bacterium]